jgi:hypothetical protein
MKDCYYDLGLHFILLDDPSQSYILKLRDRGETVSAMLPGPPHDSLHCAGLLNIQANT